jgi:hypothetical protein
MVDYFTSGQSVELHTRCPLPTCPRTIVGRYRMRYLGVGPTFSARVLRGRVAVLLGASLGHQRSFDVSSWHGGVPAGLGLTLLQIFRGSIALGARGNQPLTGAGFAPWLTPLGLRV